MSIRKTPFANGEYYHIFNRGVDKRLIFTNQDQQYFFFRQLSSLNNTDSSLLAKNIRNKIRKQSAQALPDFKSGKACAEKLVSIVAYSLLPNHYHLLLKQLVDDGISKLMQRLGTSYTMFFNSQEKRSGSLFQGKFKANHLSGDFALPTVSAYVNLNHKHHQIDPKKHLVKSSIFEYFSQELGDCICDQDEINKIIAEAGGLDAYKKYIKQASITFADNKNVLLNADDFEF